MIALRTFARALKQCDNERPCAACKTLGLVCEDWRPGDVIPQRQQTPVQPLIQEDLAPAPSTASSNSANTPSSNIFSSAPQITLPNSSIPVASASVILSWPIPQGITASHSTWPNQIRPDRHLSVAFPFESLYHNEYGYLKSLSASSGLPMLVYLEAYAKQQSLSTEGLFADWLSIPYAPNIYEPSIPTSPMPPIDEDVNPWDDMEAAIARRQPDFVGLVLSVTSLAQHQRTPRDIRRPHSGNKHLVLFNQLRLKHPKTNWSSLDAIQALFYFGHFCYGETGEDGVSRGHSLMNEAVSRCIDSGLHRDVEPYADTFNPSELEVRRRTLWAVYCGDKISAAFGRPPMLRLADIDIPEIDVESPAWSERATVGPSLLAYHRAPLYLVNRSSTRRKETSPHFDSCTANHQAFSFDDEIGLLNHFQTADLPPVSSTLDDDNFFHVQRERIRTLCSFIKMFIYRHLMTMVNTDLPMTQPNHEHNAQVLHWSRDLLSSQRKIISRGTFTDFSSTASYQISQCARALIPVIYIESLTRLPDDTMPEDAGTKALSLAIDLLRDLSRQLPAAGRSLDIVLQSTNRLNVSTSSSTSNLDGIFGLEPEAETTADSPWITTLPLKAPAPQNKTTVDGTWDWLSSLGLVEGQPQAPDI
ncbi:hypothetical protein T439DRAFT_354592 [Meredithblackwellia eburnea MCA 4105]